MIIRHSGMTLAALWTLGALVTGSRSMWPFPSKRFTANAFVDAQSLGLEDAGRIVAFGDFDGNQFLDVVTLAPSTSPFSEQNLLHIYTWSHTSYQYFKNSTLQSPAGDPIINVVPGDFTHSGRLDLLVMAGRGSRLKSWVFVGTGKGFEPDPIAVPPSTLAQPIPLDYDGNMRLDLLGNLPRSTSTPSDQEGLLTVWKNVWDTTGDEQVLFDTVPFEGTLEIAGSVNETAIPKCFLPNPHSSAVIDLDGDCLADLFLLCRDPSSDAPTYQIWLNDAHGGWKLSRIGSLPKGTGMISWGDINRDGALDMVFPTCETVDASGVGHGCKINIAYNKQMGFCQGSKTTQCRIPSSLCSPDPSFTFDLSPEKLLSIPVEKLMSYTSNDPTVKSDKLLMLDTTLNPPIPLGIKVGDANLDGFPDLLFISVSNTDERTPQLAWNIDCTSGEPGCPLVSPSKSTKSTQVQIRRWLNLFSRAMRGDFSSRANEPIIDDLDDLDDTPHQDRYKGRGFVIASAGGDASVLSTFKDARSATFLDVDEDGTLDILVQRTGRQEGGGKGPNSEGSGVKVNFIKNNVFHDAFFMKAIVLNGACGGMCTPKGEASYHPFGVSHPGATYKYTILSTTGKRSAAAVAQLPQTNYHALLTPYSFFGLGRTNNYVEELFVGSTRKFQSNNKRSLFGRIESEEMQVRESINSTFKPIPPNTVGEGLYYISLEGVIPNSKVVIIPPDSPTQVAGGDWKRELYLRPGEWIPWVSVTVVVTVVLLGGVVWGLWWNERREDELERRKALHSINFDAL